MERPGLSKNMFLEQLKKSDEAFRNTMEGIFQRYSNLNDPGPELCLKTMTLTSKKGTVPLDSAKANKELQDLKNRLQERSLEGLDRSQEEHTISDQDPHTSLCQMDVDETVDDLDHPSLVENSLESGSVSRSCMRDELSQPEEEDHELEQTLSSHGSTLLDVYPSMLNQIGESYRRQHVADMASAVLRRYRRRRLQSFQKQQHNRSYNNSLYTTKQSSVGVPKPPCKIMSNHKEVDFNHHGSFPQKKRKQDFSPLKYVSNALSESTACFYSPRRDDVEKEVEPGPRWTGQRSNGEAVHRPVRVLDLSTPPSFSPPSPPLDLNQTYIVEPARLPRSQGVRASSISGPTCSPLKMAIMFSQSSQGGSSVHRSPSLYGSGLRKDHYHSPTASPQKASSSHVSQLRSPLKARIPSLDYNQQRSLSNPKPVIRTSETYRSPYNSSRSFSPRHQDNSTKQLKHRPSFSGRYSPSTSIPKMASKQLDAEFMGLYHYFICRRANPTSSCHLCKRQSWPQSPAMFSKSMSALSLTPVRSQKRRREPEVFESLRFKRFRESCSPHRTTQYWPKHQQEENRYMKTSVVEPSDDKYTWNRSLLLQCPSPGFLHAIRQHKRLASGSGRKGPGSGLDARTQYYSPSWRDSVRYRSDGENFESTLPMRTWDESGASGSPRMSRRRLLYGPVQ